MRLSPPYSRYAFHYDSLGQNKVGAALAFETLKWLRVRRLRPQVMADVATGTGAAAEIFAAAGLTVIGLDRSISMLQATPRADWSKTTEVHLVQGDLTDLPFAPELDLITCFFDSANYLEKESDLQRFFNSAARSLRPSGLLIFDLNTRRRMEIEWSDSCFVAVDRPDLFGIYRSWFEPDQAVSPLVLTFFEKVGDHWLRFDEEHIERVFDNEMVVLALQLAGFDLIESLEFDDRLGRFNGGLREETLRAVFIARKIG